LCPSDLARGARVYAQKRPVAQWIEQRFYTTKRRFQPLFEPNPAAGLCVLSTASSWTRTYVTRSTISFRVDKELETDKVETRGFGDRFQAERVIADALARYADIRSTR
jgi:hypothetical protein